MLFKIANYENYILQALLKSKYARELLVVMLTYITTSIVKFHLACIICWLVSGSTFGDLILPVFVNVVLALFTNRLFLYIGTHRPQYEELADYLIENYSQRNFVIWKRYVMLIILAYVLLVGFLVPIDNYLIISATIQTAISFIICEILEHRCSIFKKYMQRFQLWWNRPKVQKYVQFMPIINNYGEDYSDIVSNEIYKNPESPPITPKSSTPPRVRKT